MIISLVDAYGVYTGTSKDVGEFGGAPSTPDTEGRRWVYLEPPASVPEGKVAVYSTDRWDFLVNATTPQYRRLIPKSLVQARAATAGKLTAIFNLLLSQPTLFSQWFAPDWPNVYFDDPGLLMVMDAVGCTQEQKDAITAPHDQVL